MLIITALCYGYSVAVYNTYTGYIGFTPPEYRTFGSGLVPRAVTQFYVNVPMTLTYPSTYDNYIVEPELLEY